MLDSDWVTNFRVFRARFDPLPTTVWFLAKYECVWYCNKTGNSSSMSRVSVLRQGSIYKDRECLSFGTVKFLEKKVLEFF